MKDPVCIAVKICCVLALTSGAGTGDVAVDRTCEPLWSHIRTVDDLGELRDVSASFDGVGAQRVLRLQVKPSSNVYSWVDVPAPAVGWKLNTREAVEMEIRNCGDKPAEVMLWVVARHGWDAVGSFATVPVGAAHLFRCSLREAFPDGTPKIDPGQVKHLRIMARQANPGTRLEVRCPVALGQVNAWTRLSSRLDVPDMEEGVALPSAGRRVRYALAGDEKNGIYSALYLPPEWKQGGRYPVIAEYSGNIFYVPACYSTGRPEQCVIGYGMTKGVGAIWVSLPFVDRKNGRVAEDGWGEADATADYAVRAVETICRDFGGDRRNVVLTGFSRGAIACGYIGLRNEQIAALWKGFHACQHYDGDGWGGADMAGALKRAHRFAGRAVFQTDNPAKNIPPLMEIMKAETTFVQSGLHAHACAMFLDDRPSTLQLRAWFQNLMEKQ